MQENEVSTQGLWRRSALYMLSWSDFDLAVGSLAAQVRASGTQFDQILGISRGGLVPAVALCNALDIGQLSIVSVPRNVGSGQYLEKQPAIVQWLSSPEELRGERVLIVDDVAGSGETLDRVRAEVDKTCGIPSSTAVVVRMQRGQSTPDMVAVELDDWVVFPWEDRQVSASTDDIRSVTIPIDSGAQR